MREILFGAAYYDEYMPCERLREDIQMMKKAGINTVRIAESTWSTCEPQEGVFDFSHVEKVIDAMEEAGIHVCNSYMDGEIPSGCTGRNSKWPWNLRSPSDYGYHASGFPVLCRKSNPGIDEAYRPQKLCNWLSGG